MDRSNSLSITALVIVLALLGLFVGYLLGNWFIQVVTGGNPDTQQVQGPGQNEVVEEELIIEDENENQDNGKEEESFSDSNTTTSQIESYSESNDLVEDQLKGEVYVVQVGAFNKRDNALDLKEELTRKGFQVMVTDEGLPYKVQIRAFTDREKAKELEEKVEQLGYDAFITH